jgi:hypothetical protein
MDSSAEALTPVVENGGFTIVEQDDVAFALSLCKEIHRIYGSYQSGELEAGDDSVRLGLLLTSQMLSTLGGAVTKGMPAMRLEVAAAQTREMVAVLFGEPITAKKPRSGRARVEPRCQRQLATPGPSAKHTVAPGPEAIAALGEGSQTNNSGGPPAAVKEPSATGETNVGSRTGSEAGARPRTVIPLLARARQAFARSPIFIRVLLGILGCGLAAVLIDVPLVILLLFSNLFLPLTLSFVCIAALAPRATRSRISRLVH